MIELTKRVGRLLTVRFLSPVTEDEWDRFDAEIREVVRTAPSQVIFCTDLRYATVFTERIADQFIESMRANSPKVKRAAVILPSDGAVLALQFERIVREVGYSWRRTFRREWDATTWLGEVLLPPEQESLSAFLAERVSGSRLPPIPAPSGSRLSSSSSRPPPLPGGFASPQGGQPSPIPSAGSTSGSVGRPAALTPLPELKPTGGGKPSGGKM